MSRTWSVRLFKPGVFEYTRAHQEWKLRGQYWFGFTTFLPPKCPVLQKFLGQISTCLSPTFRNFNQILKIPEFWRIKTGKQTSFNLPTPLAALVVALQVDACLLAGPVDSELHETEVLVKNDAILRTFHDFLKTFSWTFQGYLRNFSGLFKDFLRTLRGLSQGLLMSPTTFQDFLQNVLELS